MGDTRRLRAVGGSGQACAAPGYPGAVQRPPVLALAALLCAGLVACTPTPAPPPSTSPTASASPSPDETLLATDTDHASAVGTLAPDFPRELVPVPEGAEVLVSAAEPTADGLLRISLNLRTEQDAAALLDAVRGPLVAAGFTESAPPVPEAGLAAQATFSRADGDELLVVGVLDRDGTRTMTLGGTVARPAP